MPDKGEELGSSSALVPVAAECDGVRPFSELDAGELISGPGGELEVPIADRRLIAAFRGGLAVVAKGSRWSPEVKAVLDRAFRTELDIHRIVESDSETILAAYEQFSSERGDGSFMRGTIERQRDLRRIIAQAADSQASDIHFKLLPGYCEIRIRVHGKLCPLANRAPEEGIALMNAAFAVAADQGTSAGATSFMKGALTRASGLLPAGVDLARLQYSPASGHRPFLAMRLKYSSGRNLSDLEGLGYLPRQLQDFSLMRRRTSGLYLLAGKVSSGKTTTLQRLLNAMVMEKSHEISVFAIEEPVELDVAGAVHVAVAARSGQSRSEAFIEAVKATLRSDPNIVVIGELRDRELANHAIELAMTGHALWSTVHAGSALGILDRLSDLGIEGWKLADTSIVRGLIYQRLIGLLCPECKSTFPDAMRRNSISPHLAETVIRLTGCDASELFVRGLGCGSCSGGFAGRSVVAETLLPDPKLLDLYLRGNRTGMRDHWLTPRADGGLGGWPAMHHAMIKVGLGICDVNEIEEEVELVGAYEREFARHAASLADSVAAARQLQ
ncbi:MAG: ATPase, T2SS/T4P/T4SS family [Rhodobacteraceae bacterium]|nr:ATPase, T2SS/T4P/T4SS family [Paracoccaceae bacterium]